MALFSRIVSLFFLTIGVLLADMEYSFSKLSDKKQRFINEVMPAIESVHAELEERYNTVLLLTAKEKLSSDEQMYLDKLKHTYRVDNNTALLKAIKPFPKSIALAQAAVESAWGTSRFFKEANNIFGVHATNPAQDRVAAQKMHNGRTVWVRKYDSLKQSIKSYYYNLATSLAYKEFRNANFVSDDPYTLVNSLQRYSEKGKAYCTLLTSIIKFNNFTAFDALTLEKIHLALD